MAPILPALVLQLATLGALGRANRWTPHPLLQQAARHALTALLAIALVVQIWSIAATPSRRALTIANFSVAPQCVLVSPTWVPIYTDRAMAAAGQSVRSALAWWVSDGFAVTLPLGSRAEPVLAEIASRFAPLVDCARPAPAERVAPSGLRRFPASINPLDVLSAIALAVALFGAVRSSATRRAGVR
jgi:hypothetical protein